MGFFSRLMARTVNITSNTLLVLSMTTIKIEFEELIKNVEFYNLTARKRAQKGKLHKKRRRNIFKMLKNTKAQEI